MDLGFEGESRREAPRPQRYEWNAFNKPLVLKAADEFGAMFQEPNRPDAAWYLNVNEMQYRPLEASDLPADRLEHARPYPIAEQEFANGTEAAMAIREQHLVEQMQPLKLVNHALSENILEGMQEELDLVRAYLHETDAIERERLVRDLGEIYKEMREDVLEEKFDDAA